MAINVISDAPYVFRCVLRTHACEPAQPDVPQPAVTTENWDIVHWPQFRYEIVDSLTPYPDALAAFLVVVESFRARAVNGKIQKESPP